MILSQLKAFFSEQLQAISCGLFLKEYFHEDLFILKHFFFYTDEDGKGNYKYKSILENLLDIPAQYVEYNPNGSDIERSDLLKTLYRDTTSKRHDVIEHPHQDIKIAVMRSIHRYFKNVTFSAAEKLKYANLKLLSKIKPKLIPENWEKYVGVYYQFNDRYIDTNFLASLTKVKENVILVTDNYERAKIDLLPIFNTKVELIPINVFDTLELGTQQENEIYQKNLVQYAVNLATTKQFIFSEQDVYSACFIQTFRKQNGYKIKPNYINGPLETYFICGPNHINWSKN